MDFRRSFDFDRRRFLIGGPWDPERPGCFGATEFLENAKNPSAWTEDEIVMLTTKSPWAREAVPNIRNADDPTGGSVLGESGRGEGRRRTPAKVIVRWESAQPILDALRAPLAADLEGHYVVSVTNLPFTEAHRAGRGGETTPDDTLERMQNGATLQVKDKDRDTAEAGIARRTRIGSILFGFSKDQLRLSTSDGDIVFALNTQQLTLKTNFNAKEMIYHGKLAV